MMIKSKKLTPYEMRMINLLVPDALYNADILRLINKKTDKEINEDTLITKEMTKEEFKEEEHPRDSDGRFTEKYDKETSAVHHEKGSWGGIRKNAGRLPNDPIKLRENLRSRFKTENENISDDEVKQKVIDYAIENKKPDLILLEKDPIEFQKKRDEELLIDAAKDRYRQPSYKGSRYTVDGPEDTAIAKEGVNTSVNKWKQEVSKSENVIDAIKTFLDTGEVDKLEKQKSILLGATALIVTSVSLAAILLKRPDIKIAGGTILESLKKSSIRAMTATGKIDPKELPNPSWFRILKMVEPPKIAETGVLSEAKKWTEIDKTQVGTISRLLGKALTGKKDQAVVLGAKWKGLSGRWNLPKWHIADRTKAGDNYRPREFDSGAKYGLRLVDSAGREKEPVINLLNLAIETGKIKRYPSKNFIEGEFGLTTRKVKGKKVWHLENKKAFEDKYFNGKATVSDFPKEILRKTTKGEMADFEDVQKGYGTMAEHIEKAMPLISRKVLALLSVGTGLGTPGLFYFQKELEESSKGTAKAIEEQVKAGNEPSKADTEKTSSSSKKIDLDLARAERKAVEAKIKLEKEKQVTEALKKSNAEKKPEFDPTQGLSEEDIPNSKKQESKGLYDIVMKALHGDDYDEDPNTEDSSEPIAPGIYDIADIVGDEVASMISDISQSCKNVIENGVPTHSQFEELNQVINEIYGYMKDQAKLAPPEEIEEENQISEKSFDKNESKDEKEPEKDTICTVCGKQATEEQIAQCQEALCPNNYLNMIVDKE